MTNDRHIGSQNSRDNRRNRRLRKQVKYVILTDGEKTENNYFTGLKNSLKEGTPLFFEIETGIETEKLIERCKIYKNEDIFLNHTKIWIVFDKDRVRNFDEIILEAKRIKCEVAWSNPCIEEWFWAYFKSLGSHHDSVTTNNLFKELFMTKTGKRYAKNIPNLYEILRTKGDEEKAIHRAEEKLTSLTNSGVDNPSEMYSATTVFKLVREWRNLEASVPSSDGC